MKDSIVTKKNCCCQKMWEAVKEKGPIPINLDGGEWPSGIEFWDNPHRAKFETEEEFLFMIPYGNHNNACPFCGKNISSWRRRRRDPKYSKGLCKAFLCWFEREEDDLYLEQGMIEYDHRNNQFYLRNRKGFSEGYTPIYYCTHCGEPLSAMVEKYGIPDAIRKHLKSDEWWKKRGL